jgi:uncharacterized protein
MKRILLALAVLGSAALSFGAPPSDASIKELLTLSEASKLLDSVKGQINGMSQNMMNKILHGQPVTPAQSAAFNKYFEKCNAVMTQELSWSTLEPIYTRIYRDTFTQEEIDGIIAFYKTPAGQALVKKMPVLMQKVMAEMPTVMGPIMQKIQSLAGELMADLKAAEATPVPVPEPAPATAPAK